MVTTSAHMHTHHYHLFKSGTKQVCKQPYYVEKLVSMYIKFNISKIDFSHNDNGCSYYSLWGTITDVIFDNFDLHNIAIL